MEATEWASALSLTRVGTNEFHGPCPVCGGHDRFFISKGRVKPIVYHCRMGCDFIVLTKNLEERGLIKNEHNRSLFKDEQKRAANKKKNDAEEVYPFWVSILRGRLEEVPFRPIVMREKLEIRAMTYVLDGDKRRCMEGLLECLLEMGELTTSNYG